MRPGALRGQWWFGHVHRWMTAPLSADDVTVRGLRPLDASVLEFAEPLWVEDFCRCGRRRRLRVAFKLDRPGQMKVVYL